MTLKIRVSTGIVGTRLPNTPTTGEYFRYQGPIGPHDEEARRLVARFQVIKAAFAASTARAAGEGE